MKRLTFKEFCLACFEREIQPTELLPISYSFAQSNYAYYLAAISYYEYLSNMKTVIVDYPTLVNKVA